jgi:hypothetical protein
VEDHLEELRLEREGVGDGSASRLIEAEKRSMRLALRELDRDGPGELIIEGRIRPGTIDNCHTGPVRRHDEPC